ncbi:hypothetical protein E5P55_00710 [Candidatus Pinguicoccus supinus]|uniref:Uncharacterized protein n=1 Tax=Candidatus Pinguicoccus supinus TaxID=2529394 RepID=A0A7T0FYB2_9BACT|nr:hypothetical protein E5P55_00710 [Candidatus Pinguicoccus supinus]
MKNKKNLLLDLKVIVFKKINKFLKKKLPDNSFFSFDLSTTNYLKKILKKYVSLTCVGEKFLTNFHEKILFVLYSIIKDLKRLNGEYTNKIALNKIFKNFCIGK